MEWIREKLSTTQLIILSFLAAIFIGAGLLCLPVAAVNGETTPFIDALFTAVTSVCVTGLVTVTTATHWSLFGHVVILILIQMGGLGVVTMTITVMMILGKKISLRNRMLLGDAFNLDTLKGLVRFMKRVLLGTFLVEGIGAACFLPVFIPEYGILKGIWYSVFHAVSAFCNAGIDLVGESSFIPYVHNVWVNIVTMLLIILGGIGFVVWWDILTALGRKRNPDTRKQGFFKGLTLHSQIVLSMTLGLIFIGGFLFLLFEYHNPLTIGQFSFGQKLLAALFQSVTTRTAGFAMIPQEALTIPSVIVALILMFIGGSSVGTAGGVKTSTMAVLVMAVMATVRGQEEVSCFHRRISEKMVRKALSVILISFLVSIAAVILMLVFEDGDAFDIIFETYSALGTAGLTRNFTSTVGTAGKLILSICMFLGRIGPITMVIAFTMKDKQSPGRLPEEKITVG